MAGGASRFSSRVVGEHTSLTHQRNGIAEDQESPRKRGDEGLTGRAKSG